MKQRIEAAQALLKWLSVHGVPAVICGGYARDTIMSQPIRDVDVYVSENGYRVACSHLGDVASADDLDEKDEQYVHQSIKRQQEFELLDYHDFGLPTRTINLIGLHEASTISVEDVTSRFNLGICKAGIDLNGISVTDDFRADYKDKQITLLRTDWGHEASLKQFIKLQTKYPWPLRVRQPEEGFNAL
ncbi:hypothetical protein UP09_03360 [Bradyrhizobium sp. LTSP885]|uniref:hypothetical protein n=1 Tax=Bradyrhizobium sp. LTSP885 TaxID=1619232 RepID=UPI0005C9136C|nr:hypothetical protein [Bradyrhizobium sp. LTSP885]KJC51092.1 hypothetical protein UP09_03360 [Bradyrhizobium sp. LTSP885]